MINKTKFINYLPIIVTIFIIFLYFIFFEKRLWPETDEIVSITTFSDYRTLFLKYVPNNHVITSAFGFLLNNIFGVNLILLRLTSFVCFVLILLTITKKTNDNFISLIIIVVYLFYNVLIDYSLLFRGYYFSSLMFILVFFYLQDVKGNTASLKKILIILSILTIHSISSIYLVLPILILLSINLIATKRFIYFKYFLVPTIFFYLVSLTITGLYLNKNEILTIYENNYNYLDINLLKNLYYKSFKAIFFPEINSINIINNLNIFINTISKNYIVLSIFIASVIKSLINTLKNKKIIDMSVLLFFLTIFFVNKIPPERIFVNYIFFLTLYLLYDLKIIYNNKKILNFLKIFTLILILFKLSNFKIYTSEEIDLINENEKKNLIKINCNLKLNSKNEFDYHYYYYNYLIKCNKKPNIFEFYYFYKSRTK